MIVSFRREIVTALMLIVTLRMMIVTAQITISGFQMSVATESRETPLFG